MSERTRRLAKAHLPGARVPCWSRVAAAWLSCTLLLSSLATADAGTPRVALQLSPHMPADTARRLTSAIHAELADVAQLASVASAETALCNVLVSVSAQGMVLQFTDASGTALSVPRSVSHTAPELLASQIASMVRAFVLARLEENLTAEAQAAPSALTEPATRDSQAVASAPPQPLPAPNTSEPSATAATGARPVDLPSRPARPQQPADARESWRVRLLSLYSGVAYAEQLAWWHGLRVESCLRLLGGLYAGASYAFHLPRAVESAALDVSVRGHDGNLFVGVGRTGRSFGVAADLGAGLSAVRRETTRTAAMLEKTPTASTLGANVTLRVHARMRFPSVPRMSLDLAPALELAFGAAQLVAELEPETPVLSPRRLRARLDVGASWDLL